ncbi:ABC-type dipeptide transport system, periplasmic component [Treponema sp. JC4]|uniref:ABC transporter substrate-binding protein n=1 Tax=Treponema sp. JC4 TaxID=1124982 RepID=UPI00025B0712|nr:ABC transporter substrate-binding protein [Treponema sp. JC4]EID85221.1 ABC-type dipeptide transport system, periplasmic component [Treponema sp. JC4]
MKNKIKKLTFIAGLCAIFSSCKKTLELDIAEIDALQKSVDYELLKKSRSKPYQDQAYVAGKVGGIWHDSIISDPKTFNQLVGYRDGASNAIISKTTDYLFDYESSVREWRPHLASARIEVDEAAGTLTVHCTIREDAFWTWYNSDKKIPVTSDDFVFWYNEIEGDLEAGLGGYEGQCISMPDGSERHIDCIKLDDKNFDFVFPRIVAEPYLSVNMDCCPSFIFAPAKKKGGIAAVKNLFSVDVDPKTIPSCGMFYITEYVPSRRLVFTRNPYYWEKDENGTSIPYYEQLVCQIVGDQNTNYLLFTQGKMEAYAPRPEELHDVVNNQKEDYTVFNADGSMSSQMWSFNQNPLHKEEAYYKWFTKKEFRQAMSCLVNRERIISQTYRGLAQPQYFFFPPSNPYYNEKIQLEYRYDPQRALKLLKGLGFTQGADGILYDWEGLPVEFDLSINSGITVTNDMAQIISDEASKIGIKINVRQTDFQKMVESITVTYDWQSCFIAFGAISFPTQGSNVWQSSGNFHVWYPMQKSPATDWEARVDQLYEEGAYTVDHGAAKKIWDEYQSIILEECPIIYLVRSRSFFAIRNRWNLENVYYDNRHGALTEHVFLDN